MKVPISWIKDFVDIKLPIEELAHRLTLTGLEVEEIRYVGLPLPAGPAGAPAPASGSVETAITGLEWDRDKIVVAEIRQVMPHPNADRLVLCKVYDGDEEHTVLTGAPNLFAHKSQGPLQRPLKVAYAKLGARLYDGHQAGWQITTLKPAKIRGVESTSMVCSEKELGISDAHEGVIILDDDAPVGQSLADYMGDAVYEIDILPNVARNANMLGVAREVAALTGESLRPPAYEVDWHGPSIEGRVGLEIREPELNPRFVLGLIEGVQVEPSPYWVQRRLRLAGMRPINNIVDSTNYVMLEIGEPLHAFDYDVLSQRVGGNPPTIITRTAEAGERLLTLDGVERSLDDHTVLVTDEAGALSIAGVIGGEESEVSEATRNVLLEGAAWNFINIRQTLAEQKVTSEAAYRFSRGVHPAMAERGVRRGLELMRKLAGGVVAEGLVDKYPLPPKQAIVEITPDEVARWLGLELGADEMAELLRRLDFEVTIQDGKVRASAPDHRLDIGEGMTGKADLMEELARLHGYDRIPETLLADELPRQRPHPATEADERIRDLLVDLGAQEVVTYRLTTPERESLALAPGSPEDDRPYVRLSNPISADRVVMRHNLLASLLEVVQSNARLHDRLAIFEIGPVYLPVRGSKLPEERPQLGVAMTGRRFLPDWQKEEEGESHLDFFDLKGVVENLMKGLHIDSAQFSAKEHPSFHPGKCAALMLEAEEVGVLGEVHPMVAERYELTEWPVVAAVFDLDPVRRAIPDRYNLETVPAFPPVLEDIAVVVDDAIPAAEVAEIILKAGGPLLADLRLFDLYRGEQIEPGKKSLAYSLVYQAPDRTLTDEEVAEIRQAVVKSLERQLGAKLRD